MSMNILSEWVCARLCDKRVHNLMPEQDFAMLACLLRNQNMRDF